jgi:DMSO/TMAO reductase YedYZ molybdopterin-dependent catalytic subunit
MKNTGSGTSIRRRDFLGSAIAASSLGFVGPAPGAAAAQAPQTLIVRESEPRNLEFPFASLNSFITPTELFYVRSHFAVPRVDLPSWRLKVEGWVKEPFEIGYEDLRQMAKRTITALLECAGNSRIFLVPRARGLLWESGAVGNAEWTGVPLASLLEKSGVKDGAVEVVLEGADKGSVNDEPKSPGEIQFARSLPINKAKSDVLIAHQMNGRDLTASHGFPARAIVPGWYGMASIKWLTRIIVLERPFAGYYQTMDYSYFERNHGVPSVVPLSECAVKAQIARPARFEIVPKATNYRIHGAAWAGESEIAKVEISTDGGKTWSTTELLGESIPHSWRLWEFNWRTPDEPCRKSLMAKATDERGRTQPMQRDADLRNVMIHHVLPVEITVS